MLFHKSATTHPDTWGHTLTAYQPGSHGYSVGNSGDIGACEPFRRYKSGSEGAVNMRGFGVWFALVVGCAAPEVDQEPINETPAGDTDLPEYVFDGEPPELPTIEEIQAAITDMITEIPEIDAIDVLAGYDALLPYEQANCPKWTLTSTQRAWRQTDVGCTTDAGARFQGKMFFKVTVDPVRESLAKATMTTMRESFGVEGDLPSWNERVEFLDSVIATGHVELPDGDDWEASGDFHRYMVRWAGVEFDQHELAGVYTPQRVRDPESWIGLGWVPNLEITHVTAAGTDRHHREITGSVAGIAGRISAMEFREVTIAHAQLWGACELEPHGVIAVRSEEGQWIDVAYDGLPYPAEGLETGDECDRCGVATFGEIELGTVCVDFRPLLEDYRPSGSE